MNLTGPALADQRAAMNAETLRTRIDVDARWLDGAGVRRVGLLAANGMPWVIADRALEQAGALNVPLPQHFSAEQLSHAIDDAGLDAFLTDDPSYCLELATGFTATNAAPGSGLSLLRRQGGFSIPCLPAGTQKITYTSGSTAAPKGVCLTAASMELVIASLVQLTQHLGSRRHMVLLPLATLLENLAGVCVPLRAGASCVVPSAEFTGVTATSVDPERLLHAISTMAPESLILVPQLLQVLVSGAEQGWQVPDSLRFIAVGGARVSADLLERAEAMGLPCYEGYGLSECASVVAINTPDARRAGSVGRPLPHARVSIGNDGEIRVAGAVMAGYTGQSEPSTHGEIATGDLGSLDDDGFLYVHGRRRNVFINAFGRNLSPEWIEAELTSSPCIAQAMVCGEARPFSVAVLSPAGPQVSESDAALAVAAANRRLPTHAQIGRWLLVSQPFNYADGLLTANGRPRREAIARRYQDDIDALYFDALAG